MYLIEKVTFTFYLIYTHTHIYTQTHILHLFFYLICKDYLSFEFRFLKYALPFCTTNSEKNKLEIRAKFNRRLP